MIVVWAAVSGTARAAGFNYFYLILNRDRGLWKKGGSEVWGGLKVYVVTSPSPQTQTHTGLILQ